MNRTPFLALVLLGGVSAAHANFLVDDFSSAPMGPFASSSAATQYGTTLAPAVFGGTRIVQWTKRNAVASSWGVSTTGGGFYGDNGTSADVYLASYYGVTLDGSGNRYVNDNNWDFSAVSGFNIYFKTAPTAGYLTMRLYNGTGGPVGAGRDYGYVFSSTNPTVAYISLANNILGTPGAFDATRVDGFRVAYDTIGGRFEIDRIEAVSPVPEPAPLLALGMATLGIARRRSAGRRIFGARA